MLHWSEKSKAVEEGLEVLNSRSSSGEAVEGAMRKLAETGAVYPFSEDSKEGENPGAEMARWVYGLLAARLNALVQPR